MESGESSIKQYVNSANINTNIPPSVSRSSSLKRLHKPINIHVDIFVPWKSLEGAYNKPRRGGVG